MCPSTSPQWFRSVRFGSQPGDVFARRGEVLRIDPRRRAASLVGQSPPSLPPADGRTAGRRRLWRLEKPDRHPVKFTAARCWPRYGEKLASTLVRLASVTRFGPESKSTVSFAA